MREIDVTIFNEEGWSKREEEVFQLTPWNAFKFKSSSWSVLAFPFELFSLSNEFKTSLQKTLIEIGDCSVCLKSSETSPDSTMYFLHDIQYGEWDELAYSILAQFWTNMFGTSCKWGVIYTIADLTLLGATRTFTERFLFHYGGFDKIVEEYRKFYQEEGSSFVATHPAHKIKPDNGTFLLEYGPLSP